jgi:hypothetical protein
MTAYWEIIKSVLNDDDNDDDDNDDDDNNNNNNNNSITLYLLMCFLREKLQNVKKHKLI